MPRGGSGLPLPLSLVAKCASSCVLASGRQTYPHTISAAFGAHPYMQGHLAWKGSFPPPGGNSYGIWFERGRCLSYTVHATDKIGNLFDSGDRANLILLRCDEDFLTATDSRLDRCRHLSFLHSGKRCAVFAFEQYHAEVGDVQKKAIPMSSNTRWARGKS